MKDIRECFNSVKDISESINESLGNNRVDRVDESLKDIIQNVKKIFKNVFEYIKGVVVRVGTYFVPVDKDGNVMNAISPLTAGAAYKDGYINKNNTCVVLDKEGSRITGLKTKYTDALSLYGSGNSLQYWKKMVNEAQERREANGETVNEVRLQNQDPQAKYNIIVDDDKLKNRIKMALKNKKLARLMIWGAPGIGKTAILTNVLDEMRKDFPDYLLVVKTLSNETPDNFTLPTYVDTESGRKADDVPKTWLPVYRPTGNSQVDTKLDEACGNGLLFIDELSRATPQVLNVVLPLINEGVFNGYVLGSGWTIVVASNRPEDELLGQSDIGNALSNRFAQVYYEPTVNTWRKWADKQNFISPLLLQWLSMPESENMSGGKFFYMDPNDSSDSVDVTKLICTPRSWTNAMRELACYSYTGSLEGFTIFDIDKDIIASVLNQYVPSDAVDSFLAFLEVISKIGNFDDAVRDIWKNGGKKFKLNKKDLDKIILPIAQLVITSHANHLPSEEEFVNLCTWLVAQDSDQLTSYVLDVFKNVYFEGYVSDPKYINAAFGIVHHFNKAVKEKGWSDSQIEAQKKLYTNIYNRMFSKWGITFDSMPNYVPGQQLIAKKFGESFMNAVVGDHTSALG